MFEAIVYSFCKQQKPPLLQLSAMGGLLGNDTICPNINIQLECHNTHLHTQIDMCLVAFIYAYDSISKLLSLEPTGLDSVQWVTCWDTGLNMSSFITRLSGCTRGVAWASASKVANCSANSTQAISYVSPDKVLQSFPDCSIGTLEHSTLAVVSSGVYVMSTVIFIGTFLTAYYLKQFRGSLLCTNLVSCKGWG